MNWKINLLFSLAVSSMIACSDDEENSNPEVICTLDFKTFPIKILNDTLTDHYTTRPSILDTIVADGHVTYPDSSYIVLSDAYHADLKGQTDTFYFHGFINDSLELKEKYVFTADECHVKQLSGPEEISL